MRFAVFGAGFWARHQLAAWKELGGVECAALCDRAREKAEALGEEFRIRAIYDDPEELLDREEIDFMDVITDVDSHARFVGLAAERRIPVICQKPMAPSLAEAETMVEDCRSAGIPFYVHENWRWQRPIRELKRIMNAGALGAPFRASISMVSGFPVFRNQPFFKQLDRFILMDMGSHILDVARYLFGEPRSVYCQAHRIHADIKGEDAATVMLQTDAITVTCNLGYAENYLERDHFPQTFIFVEASKGSLELAPDYWVRETNASGTTAEQYPPPHYEWADPDYDVVHSSMVPCMANLVQGLRGEAAPETTGADNLKTVRLVFAAYDSAASGDAVHLA